jgi:glycosyltransferase involved in cell wall biosynthesis
MKISIIMPSYNQGKFVEQAIRSIIDQPYPDKEIIFMDGGSTDDTMAVVERYREHIAVCVSEQDRGQSDALRKGFDAATGDVLTWLNTDDLLLPGVLAEVAEVFQQQPQRSWLLGNVIWIDEANNVLKCWKGEPYTPGWPKLGILSAGGPSAFFRKSLYERVGGINLDLHYQMDTELWWKFVLAGERYHRLDRYTWALRLHAEAKVSGHIFTDKNDAKQQKVAAAKSAEADHIVRLTSGYCLKLPDRLRFVLTAARRSISPRYLRSRLEDLTWRNRQLADVLATQH